MLILDIGSTRRDVELILDIASYYDNDSIPSSISTMTPAETSRPSPFAYILSFLIVGLCWGFTTPFIRRAALTYTTPIHPSITDSQRSWLSRQLAKGFLTILGLLKSPGYAIPLLCNLTGSVWFFLLVGKAGKIFQLLLFGFLTNACCLPRATTTVLGSLTAFSCVLGLRALSNKSCAASAIILQCLPHLQLESLRL